jgi:hypothetical protein
MTGRNRKNGRFIIEQGQSVAGKQKAHVAILRGMD